MNRAALIAHGAALLRRFACDEATAAERDAVIEAIAEAFLDCDAGSAEQRHVPALN